MSEAERLVRATLDSLSSHIAVVDEAGEIVLTNRTWRRFAIDNGIDWREVSEGTNYLAACDVAGEAGGMAEAAAFAEGLRSVLDGSTREFSTEYPCHSPSERRWFIARTTPFLASDAERQAVIVHERITERKLAEEATAHLALHDPLTALPNRRLLMDRLMRSISRQAREGVTFAVFYVDLDNFKEVNDSFGHEAGDRVLVDVARRISICLREMDTVARLGGDEFVVLLDQVSGKQETFEIAQRITETLARPFVGSGSLAVVEIS
jgi:diguanylate cyclase (GGDEF)-like protein